jgi:hypothetical protein
LKEHRSHFDQTKSNNFVLATENGFMLLLSWRPLKIQKEKLAGLQFTSTDYLSLVLGPLIIRWTISLTTNFTENHHSYSDAENLAVCWEKILSARGF